MMKNNYFFKKLPSKQSKKKDVLVIILLQETKNCKRQNIVRTSNSIFNMKKVDFDES